MNIKPQSIKLGLSAAGITITLFLAVYFYFATHSQFTNAQYFNVSFIINSFVLLPLYAIIGFIGVYKAAKIKPVTFREGFRFSFIPMTLGGIISLVFIFIAFNTFASWAEDHLQQGFVDLPKQNGSPDPALLETLNYIEGLDFNIFSIGNFFSFLPIIIFFNLMISVIFAVLLKNRRI